MGAWGSTQPGAPQSPRRIMGDCGTGYLIGLTAGVLWQIRQGLRGEKVMMKKGLFRTTAGFVKHRLRKSLRPATRFATWTFWFSFHNVLLLRYRGVDDMLNPILAAGFIPITARLLSKKRYTYWLSNKKRAKRFGQGFLGSHQSRRWHRKWKRKFVWSCFFLATLEGVIGAYKFILAEPYGDELVMMFGEEDEMEEDREDYLPFNDAFNWLDTNDEDDDEEELSELESYLVQWRALGLPATWLE